MINQSVETLLRQCTCPACSYHVAVPFMDAEWQPLATLAWPSSQEEAAALRRMPLEFVRCVDCGHVYNAEFDYAKAPYSDKPNLMYNKGAVWSQHLEWVCQTLLEHLGAKPTVVEIGCGEGHLLRAMASRRPGGRYIGFDPNASMETGGSFVARAQLFDPARHLGECRPDLILSRHVLEHLVNPLGFLQAMMFAASCTGVETQLYIEVPCIDVAIESRRTVDFYYEHNSHFTTGSFTRMLERFSKRVEWIRHSYKREVICGFARLGGAANLTSHAQEATDFLQQARSAIAAVRKQLDELNAERKIVVIWGGTGKAAAFINHYGVDAERFPLVVDSDRDKVGTFVPGAGQRILHSSFLCEHPADVVIVPMQWRVRDVLREIEQLRIPLPDVLIEHKGKLIDLASASHPY